MSLQELLGAELFAQMTEKLGDKKVAIVNDGQWFPKEKFDAVNAENKDLKTQITQRDKQIEDLGKTAGLTEELRKQLNDMQTANEKEKAEWQKKLEQQTFEHALESALSKAKAKNPRAVKALLDTSKIKLDGETMLGLEDQLKALQKSDGYLFDSASNGNGSGGANPPGGAGYTGRNPYDRKAGTWNLTEQAKLEKDNPTLAAQLAAAVGYKI